MKEKGIDNALTYQNVITSLEKCNQFDSCMKYYNEMQEHGYRPNLKIYSSILMLLFKNEKYDEGLSYYNELKSSMDNIPLNLYNIILYYSRKSGNYNEIAQLILKEMTEKNIEPDIASYTSLMEGYGYLKNLPKVYEYFEKIKKLEGINIRTYATLYNVLIINKKTHSAIKDFCNNFSKIFNIDCEKSEFCIIY